MVERIGKRRAAMPRQEGSATETGFSVLGRRPLSRPAGDIRSIAEADREDRYQEMWPRFGLGSSRGHRIHSNCFEDDPTIVGPLDDNEEYE